MLQTHTPLYKDHFKQGQGHLRSRSLNELLNLFKPLTPGKFTPVNRSTYIKKRSYSDLSNNSNDGDDHDEANDNRATKRSRTAPPIQISHLNLLLFFEKNSSSSNTSSSVRSKSLSPQKTKFSYNDGLPPLPYLLDNTRDTGSGKATVTEPKVDLLASVETLETSPSSASISLPENLAHQSKQPSLSSAAPIKEFPRAQLQLKLSGVTLPSIADALKSLEKLSACVAPTVSLDYFDTYKPNDENWRYELLDSINKSSKNFNLDRYNYLNRNSSQNPDRNRVGKPQFNSKISPKILSNGKMQSQPHRQFNHHNSFKKINFPFESNYTYLNKTYLTDVEKYPEYLELAHSLIKLLRSRPAGDSVVHHLPSYTTKSDHESVSPPSTHTKISTVTSPYGDLNGYVRSPEAEINHQGHQHNPRLNIMPSPPLMGLAGLFIANSPPSSANNDAFGVIRSPISSALPQAPRIHTFSHDSTPNSAVAAAAANSAFNPFAGMVVQMPATPQRESRAPLTPPSSKSKTKTETKSPSKAPQLSTRVCISCGSDQSPCWRPSWSIKEGQLCNSCGLRYKKTSARCLNMECKKIPAKGEWSLMQSKGKLVFEDGSEAYNCLDCGHKVEVNK